MKGISKFDNSSFYGGYDEIAVSKQKYTKEEAIEIVITKYWPYKKDGYLAVGNGYVRHGYGVDEDNEPCCGWWLEYDESKRSCPCYVFHWAKTNDEWNKENYEYIPLGN